jgi:hypothetical protein
MLGKIAAKSVRAFETYRFSGFSYRLVSPLFYIELGLL